MIELIKDIPKELLDLTKLDLNLSCKEFTLDSKQKPNGAFRSVKFLYAIDGDTIQVLYNNKEYRVRLIVVDTPEIFSKIEVNGLLAKEFTTNILKASIEVIIQIDNNSSKIFDEYNRLLAWVWVKVSSEYRLLQSLLLIKGLATIKYIDSPKLMYLKELYKLKDI